MKPFFASFMPSLFSFDSYVTVTAQSSALYTFAYSIAYSAALNESGEPSIATIIFENFEFSADDNLIKIPKILI